MWTVSYHLRSSRRTLGRYRWRVVAWLALAGFWLTTGAHVRGLSVSREYRTHRCTDEC